MKGIKSLWKKYFGKSLKIKKKGKQTQQPRKNKSIIDKQKRLKTTNHKKNKFYFNPKSK